MRRYVCYATQGCEGVNVMIVVLRGKDMNDKTIHDGAAEN